MIHLMTEPDAMPVPASGEPWDLWQDGARAPALNMAVDEVLLEDAARRQQPLLRFYGWDRPAVSIGYVQKFSAAPQTGFAVVRRPTGGGIVFHDHDFTYSVIIPAGHWLRHVDRLCSYVFINEAVRAGLAHCRISGTLATAEMTRSADRDTMVCFQTPTRYDILADGRKIAGSAQRRTRQGILHQGSIHFGGTLPLSRDHLERALLNGFRQVGRAQFATFVPSAALLARAEVLVRERYGNDNWNRRR